MLLPVNSCGAAHSGLRSHRLPLWAGDPTRERRDRQAEIGSAHLRRRGKEEAAELHHPPGDPQSNAQGDPALLPKR